MTERPAHRLQPAASRLRALRAESAGPAAFAGVDLAAAERAAAELLTAVGADLGDESLAGTPRRMARLYAELLTPAPFDATTFPNDGGYDELVVAREIPFHSLCEHHCCRSSASPTSAISRVSASSASPSSPGSSTSSPARCRCRSG